MKGAKVMTRPDRKVKSMKMLIATASVAATVGGWAHFARHDGAVAGAAQQSPMQAAVQAGQPALQLDTLALPTIAPVPTVVPAPDFSHLALDTTGVLSQAAVVVPTIAPVPPTTVPPAPTPHPKARQPLRPVTIPQPAPQAVTRSSR
jgi:hypothetical protein